MKDVMNITSDGNVGEPNSKLYVGECLMINETVIQERIVELEAQQKALIDEANKQLIGLATAIAELKRLVESFEEEESEEESK